MANRDNKIFKAKAEKNSQTKLFHSQSSRMKVNREYLMSKEIAGELNTYVSFTPFPTFNDLFAPKYSDDGKKEITPDSAVAGETSGGSGTPGVRSIFNKAGAVIIGAAGVSTQDIISKKASSWRISNNVPLMDNRQTREAIRKESGCSVSELVKASQAGLLGKEVYSYSDFMFCKYLGRMPNTYMVTLRRFPYPIDDFISSVGEADDRIQFASAGSDSMGCLVTWMGTPGNDMANILKYSVTMPFEEKKAQWNDTSGADADAGGGIANAIAAAFDPTYREQFQAGAAGKVIQPYMSKFFPFTDATPPYPASQWNNNRDTHTKAYGPVDAIKTTYMRSEGGIDFQQNITLTFDYELRSYNGINPRQAMLDLLSNILNVTYTTGTFWGGGYRGGGAHQNNIFANLNIFKARGGFTNFLDAFAQDYQNVQKGLGDMIKSSGGVVEALKKAANALGGMLMSGMLNKMGRPQKAFANSLLSPAPIGFWHVTVGNPHHPIMSMGNMILKNTTINHYGPLGVDDFPTGIRVVCELTRGKSRDLRDIEKLYMHGNDRIYSPMGPKIFDMYERAKEYGADGGPTKFAVEGNANNELKVGEGDSATTVKINDIGKMKKVLQKYFGHVDTNAILITSMEQENGANKKKKKGTAGGNSSA